MHGCRMCCHMCVEEVYEDADLVGKNPMRRSMPRIALWMKKMGVASRKKRWGCKMRTFMMREASRRGL